MKKWLGMASSAAMGIFAFIFMAFSAFFMKISYAGQTQMLEKISGYKLLKQSIQETNIDGFGLYKVFSIIMLILAVLLIAWAVVMLLQNLNVLRLKFDLELVNMILLAAFAFVVIVAFIALIVMGASSSSEMAGAKLVAGPAAGAYLNLVLALAACAGGVVAFVKQKA